MSAGRVAKADTSAPQAAGTGDRANAGAAFAAPTYGLDFVDHDRGGGRSTDAAAGNASSAITIGRADDAAEREADRAAAEIMLGLPVLGMGAAIGGLRRKSACGCDDEGCTLCRASETGGDALGGTAAPPSVAALVNQPGRSLDPAVRMRMEAGFNRDFSDVRVHDNPTAANSAAAIQARAWSLGRDIAFAEGAYRPGTPSGDRLIAHELAHVVQSRQAVSRQIVRRDTPAAPKCPEGATTDLNRHRGVPVDPVLDLGGGNLVAYLVYETYQKGETADAFGDRAIAAWVPWRFGRSSPEAQAAVLAFLVASSHGKGVVRGDVSIAVAGCNYAIGLSPSVMGRCNVLAGEASPPLPGKPAPPADAARFRSEVEAGPKAIKGSYSLPALPASINGLEIQPINGTGTYVMNIEWSAAGPDLLSQVCEAYLGAHYQWEVWDITGAPEVQSAEKSVRTRMRLSSQADARGQVATRGAGASRDLDRATEDLNARPAQIDADQARAKAEGRYADAVADEINRQTLGLEVITRYGRELLGGAADLAGDDRDRRIPWPSAGVYVVRCIANVNRSVAHARAPSVATKVVATRSAEAASQKAIDLPTEQARERRNTAKIMAAMGNGDPDEIKRLNTEAARFELQATGTPQQIIEAQLDDVNTDLAKYRKEDAQLLDAGLHPERISTAEDRKETLENQLKLIKLRAGELGTGGRAVQRVHAALVSRVTGETYPLLLQISEPALAGGQYHCVLSDVTTADTHNYEGAAPDTGTAATDRIEALRRSIASLCETSEYGDASLTLRLPTGGWLDSLPDGERTQTQHVRSSPRGIAGAKARLSEVATALAIIGIAIGSGGVGVAGGLLAAGLAADNIARRWSEGTLRPDAQMVGDLLDVLGAVAIGTRVIGSLSVFNRAGGGFVMRAVRAGAAGLRAVGAAADTLGDVGGIIIANAQTLDSLLKTAAAEREGKMSPSEARRQRASTIASALQSNAMALAGHLSGERVIDEMEPGKPHADGKPHPEGQEVRPGDPHPEGQTHPDGQPRPGDPHVNDSATPGGKGDAPPPPEQHPQTMAGAIPPGPAPAAPAKPASPGQEGHDRWVADTLAGNMGLRPPPLPRKGAPAPKVGETRYGLRNMKEAMHVYDDFRARAPGREVGIYRNSVTGEYAVVAGKEGSVGGPLRRGENMAWADPHEWGNVIHNHPNEENVLTFRNPAPQDVFNTWQEAARSGKPVTAFIEHDRPGGGRAFTAVTVTPEGHVQIEFRAPDGTVTRPPEFASLGAYADDWSSREIHLDPKSSTYKDIVEGLNQRYPDAPDANAPTDPNAPVAPVAPADPHKSTMAGALPPGAPTAPPPAPSGGPTGPTAHPASPAKPGKPSKPRKGKTTAQVELMTEAGELTGPGVDFVRRRYPKLRELPEPQLRAQFAQGGAPLEAVVRAGIEGTYKQTGGQTATNFPIFALDFRAIFDRLTTAATEEGGSRRVDGTALTQDAARFLLDARATDPAVARHYDEVVRLATDRSYRPELDWNGGIRSECRDFINYRDKDPHGRGRAFMMGEVATKIPDAIQVAFDFNRFVVIDSTAALGNPVHALKTAFYAAVLRSMVSGVQVDATDFRSFGRQNRVSE
jgi:hypothetical protein